jgi:hypothetical protein
VNFQEFQACDIVEFDGVSGIVTSTSNPSSFYDGKVVKEYTLQEIRDRSDNV